MTNRNPYKYFTKTLKDGRIKTIAVSTYAGKTVRGSAICSKEDKYDEKIGRDIATLRCAEKVAYKRLDRASRKQREAEAALKAAQKYYFDMVAYYNDSFNAAREASINVDNIK